MATTGILKHDDLYVLVNSTKFDHLTSITFSVNQETIDITSMDSSGWRDLTVADKNWSLSVEAMYAMDATEGADEAYDDLVAGTSVTLLVTSEVTGDTTYTGSAVVTSWSVNPSKGSAVTASISFEGTGAITKGTV